MVEVHTEKAAQRKQAPVDVDQVPVLEHRPGAIHGGEELLEAARGVHNLLLEKRILWLYKYLIPSWPLRTELMYELQFQVRHK